MLEDATVAIPQLKPCELVLAPLVKLKSMVDGGFVGRATNDFYGPNDSIPKEVAAHSVHSDLTDSITIGTRHGR
jgi:hypothetical protein